MPIVVYEPFLEATQDEKQYRVVKDRERWFNVVMGEKLELDEASTDRLAARMPLPIDLARALSLRLEVLASRTYRHRTMIVKFPNPRCVASGFKRDRMTSSGTRSSSASRSSITANADTAHWGCAPSSSTKR
jgi:hypothetical protein